MKTIMGIILIVCATAFVFTPKVPSPYPPKDVLEKNRSNSFREAKIESLIHKLEHEIKVDSIKIKSLKEN